MNLSSRKLQGIVRRAFDLSVAVPVIVLSSPVVVLLVIAATIDTKAWGLFVQKRIGRGGREFHLLKIRTMYVSADRSSTTKTNDARITTLGQVLRKYKLDELPQFANVVRGDMSLIGARPDVPGFADRLIGDDRELLQMRPGVTGPSSLLFRDEAQLLDQFDDQDHASASILWPAKVRINRAYQQNATANDDLQILDMTLRGNDHRLAKMLLRWDPGLGDDEFVGPLLQAGPND